MLTEQQFDCINFLEQEFLLNGRLPTGAKLEELGVCSEKSFNSWMRDASFRRNLTARGISLKAHDGDSRGILTEEQLTAANIMLDLTDNRSRKKKLADLKISTQKWEAWLRDPTFSNYLRTRAENLLPDNIQDAHLALLDRVRSGDTGAIKFYYEITGRYVPSRGDSVDLPALLMRIIEIIQRRVSSSEEAAAIAEDLLNLASGVGAVSGNSQPKVLSISASEI